MTTANRQPEFRWSRIFAWLAPVLLLVAAGWACSAWPSWQLAWMLALSLYAGFKWLTLAEAPGARQASGGQRLCYLMLWPGMDARTYFDKTSPAAPSLWEWSCAGMKLLLGIALIVGVVPRVSDSYPLVAGWVGLIGLAMVLLFGIAHVLSNSWRCVGIMTPPIMNRPLAAKSLADFWSNRWNLAFRDVGRRFVLQPLVARFGIAKATMAVFIFSGLVHDVVMSLPARAGLGLPTIYFLLQGAAVLFEKSRAGMRLGLGRGWRGRVFAAVMVLGPITLLFHQRFLERVVLPSVRAIGPG